MQDVNPDRRLPVGESVNSRWPLAVESTIGDQGSTFATETVDAGGVRDAFRCPSSLVRSQESDRSHYSAHPQLMPDLRFGPIDDKNTPADPNDRYKPYKLTQIERASDIILAGDGSQVITPGSNLGSARSTLGKINGDRIYWEGLTFKPSYQNYSDPIERTNYPEGTGEAISWRHGQRTQANFVHADGHAQTYTFARDPSSPTGFNGGDLLFRNVMLDR